MKNLLLFLFASITMILTSCNGQPYDSEKDHLHKSSNGVTTYKSKTTSDFGMSYNGKEVLRREYNDITLRNSNILTIDVFPIVTAVKYISKDTWSTTIAVKDQIFKKDIPVYVSSCYYGPKCWDRYSDFYKFDSFILVSGEVHSRYEGEPEKSKYLGRAIDLYILILPEERIFLSFDNDKKGNNTLTEVYSYDYSFTLKKITDENVIKEWDKKVKEATRK